MNEDGRMLARAAITGILEPIGWKPFVGFLKENPNAVMPPMPAPMFIQLLKENVKFSVSDE